VRHVTSDAELVGLVCAGGEQRTDAWHELVRRHAPRLFAVARSFDVDAATAEDLVQTAWLRFLERSSQLRDADSVGPWLCMIVRNEARRLVTRRRAVPVGEGWEQLVADAPAPERALVETERAVALRAAFGRLGEDCRQLLRLLLVDPPLSYDELAVILDRPRGSLGPTRRRCLEQLRRLLPPGTDLP
jgi:RNA polymerase sigma factor (sigma-70 family)